MRATTAAFLLALSTACATVTMAQATSDAAPVIAEPTRATDLSAQQRKRPRVRIYRETDARGVYPSYFPGSNAVRDCNVSYVREFRPSGAVIVPNMKCFWRQP